VPDLDRIDRHLVARSVEPGALWTFHFQVDGGVARPYFSCRRDPHMKSPAVLSVVLVCAIGCGLMTASAAREAGNFVSLRDATAEEEICGQPLFEFKEFKQGIFPPCPLPQECGG
jgi:hypothetical protein